jgi:hypothetical protein
MDTQIFDAVFWSFFITSIIGFLLKCASMAYKSKCKEVDFCCLKIVRDVEVEQEETEFFVKNQLKKSPSPSKSNEDLEDVYK